MARKQKPQRGLRIDVKNNNVDFALRKFKKMVKDSGMMLELKRNHIMKNHLKKEEKKRIYKN